MAGKVTTMSKIKQLIQLHANGVSNRQIAKQLALNKGTVNGYVSKLSSIGMSVSELLRSDCKAH
jgi:DNA-binding CsgD family transcriptional regulator